jgi:hypothetical protein
MKKLIFLLAFLALLTGTFSGCQEIFSDLPLSEDTLLSVCGSFAVPGLYCSDLKGGSFTVKVLERDSHDRILYEYTAVSVITGQKETATVICQGYDDNFLYFREDVCYRFGKVTGEALAEFKEQNRWGEENPLAGSAKRKYTVTADLFLLIDTPTDAKQVRSQCREKFGITDTQIKDLVILDTTSQSALYWLTYEDGGETKTGYLLVTEEATAFLESKAHASPEALAAFKSENGW